MRIGIKATPFNLEMRHARRELGLTQTELAELVGVSQSKISAVETFRIPIDEKSAIDIALTLGYEPDDIFPRETRDFKPRRRASIEFVTEVQSLDVLDSDAREIPVLPSPEILLEKKELETEMRTAVSVALSGLSARHREIIQFRFGLIDGEPKTLQEVADAFGISKARVSQIQTSALAKLRHPFRSRQLRQYLTN